MVEIGIKGRQEEIVTEDLTASHIGSGSVRVFATPMMIALMERTSRMSVKPYLEDGQETVGTKVDVTHVSSTPVGLKVWCESEVVDIDRRRIVFKVAAYDEKGLIGEGTHERFVIDVAKFRAKTEEKIKDRYPKNKDYFFGESRIVTSSPGFPGISSQNQLSLVLPFLSSATAP